MKLEGNYLVIRLKMKEPRLSSTGKSYLIGGTHGPKQSKILIKGKPVYYSANVYIKRDKPTKPKS